MKFTQGNQHEDVDGDLGLSPKFKSSDFFSISL